MTNYFPPVPVYPKNYDNDNTLFLVYNTSETITTADCPPWADEINIRPVDPTADEIWANNGFANIDGEMFYYDSVEKNIFGKVIKLKRCSRNLGGTTTKFNSAGSEVRGFVVAEHHNQLVDVVLKIEKFIGENFTTDQSTLDWRIRNLRELPIIFDDFSCPDIDFTWNILTDDPTTGTIARYDIVVEGSYTSFRLDFGDGSSTTSSTSGTHQYAPSATIDPVITISTDNCTVVQTPVERTVATEPVNEEPDLGLELIFPKIPDLPQIVIPTPPPQVVPQIPPIVFPCLDIGPFSIGSIPSIITFDPPPEIPSLITITPIPDIPDTITFGESPTVPEEIEFGPAPDIPTEIEFGPAPEIPTEIEFGPIPNIPTLIRFGPVPLIPTLIVFGPVPFIPTLIVFGPAPYIPTLIVFGPAPYIPTLINFGPAPLIPTLIEFGPAPTIPTLIEFGPAPNIPIEINFGPAPTIPTQINFGPAPEIPTLINFGPAPEIPTLINFGPAPEIPTLINFGPMPTIPTQISFGPAPTIPTRIDFGPAPTIPTKIEFGPAPTIPTLINFGPAPNIPTHIEFGAAPVVPTLITFGAAPTIPTLINFGAAPSVSVVWGTPPSCSCTVSVDCPGALRSQYNPLSAKLEDGFNDQIEVEIADLGIPSQIKVIVPEIPDIRVLHDIPAIIKIETPAEIKIVGPDIPLPKEIFVIAKDIPKSIELDASNLPKSIFLDTSSLPTSLKLELPENMPSIKLDFTGLPTEIQVVGIPPSIELIHNIPSTIQLVMPEKPEIEMIYKGAPIDLKIQLDVSRLTGEDGAQCVQIVPCTK